MANTESIRIGLIVYGLDRPLTGIGRYTFELVKAMSALEPAPEIVLLSAGGLGPLAGQVEFDHVELTGSRLLPGLMTIGNMAIAHQVDRLGLAVVHDPTGTSPLLLAQRKAATVVTIHDVFAWSIPGHSSLLDTMIYKKWLPRMLPRVDAVITVSEQSRQDILQYLAPPAHRINIIHYGVSPIFQPIETEIARTHVAKRFGLSEPYLLYVGALTQRKNLERLLDAFAVVHETRPRLKLVLAGPSSWKETPLEQIAHRLELSDHIVLTGPLTDQDLPALYSEATVFVFPSLYEGFGLPVIEAMACGTPVVTSRVSSLPEVAGDAAILVDPYDANAIADGICQILDSAPLAAELTAKGIVRSTRFTWEATARQTLDLYIKAYESHQTARP